MQHCEQLTDTFCHQLLQQCWQQLDNCQSHRLLADRLAEGLATRNRQNFSCFKTMQALDPTASAGGRQGQGKLKQIDSLAISRAIHNTTQRQHPALWQLKQRLSLLRGGQGCEDKDNPLAPGAICLAFQNTVCELEVEPHLRRSLYESFSALFQQRAADFYQNMNRYLIDAGILANLLPATADATNTDTAPSLPTKQQQQLEQIQNLLLKELQWPAAIEDTLDLPATLAVNSYISAGILLQRQIAAHVDFQRDQLIDPGSTLRQYFKYLVAHSNRQHAGANRDTLLSVELMTRLFQSLCSDEELPLQLRCLVSYLHVPCIKLAISDRDVLLSPRHPAREFLDLLLHQGSRWLLSRAEDPTVLHTLRGLVSTLACDLTEDSSGFKPALVELRHYLGALSQQASQAERREVQSQAGMASLDQARSLAQSRVQDALMQYQVGRGCRDHLRGPCTDFLTFVLLQHGQGHQWNQAQHLLKGIALSVKGQLPTEQLIQFQRGQQRLYNAVGKGMAETGYGGMLAQDMLASLRQSQQQMVQKLAVADTPHSQQRLPDDAIASRQALDQLQTGQWYLFTDRPRSGPILLKLAWYSEGFGRALFVDASGVRRRLEYADTLARALDKDQLQLALLPCQGCSGKALDTILHRLRLNSLRNKFSPKPPVTRKVELKIC